jgi:Ca-activated chloride channel family protein
MNLFASPWFLLTALAAPLLVWLYIMRLRKKRGAIILPQIALIGKNLRPTLKTRLRHGPIALKTASLLLIAVALARPQSVSKGQDVHSEGIDIVMALDISASMLAQDFRPDRARAAKEVAKDFIKARLNDRIGVVLFAKQAFTQCPLTVDHDILLELVDQVEVGLADADNTAIGAALAAAVNRLKGTESPSKVVILLTDGENNYGVPPTTAAEAAQAMGVRVYTIGVGTRGTAPYPARDMFGRTVMQQVPVSIDENLLGQIAQSTGGKYFRATDENKLRDIFAEIDRMEKVRVEIRAYRRYAELFYPYALAALALLILGLAGSAFYLKGVA